MTASGSYWAAMWAAATSMSKRVVRADPLNRGSMEPLLPDGVWQAPAMLPAAILLPPAGEAAMWMPAGQVVIRGTLAGTG